MKSFRDDKNIVIYLFKKEPSIEDMRLLPKIVKGFEKLNEKDKLRAEGIAKDLFSEQEIVQIFPYLTGFPDTEFCCKSATIPVSYSENFNYEELPIGGGIEDCWFNEETLENYPLKFRIRGWYDSYEAFDKELERKTLEELREKRELRQKVTLK